jgi:hypothetical protein
VALTTGRNHHSAGFGVITEQSSRYPGYDHRYWAGEGEHQRNPKAKLIRDFLVRPARLVNHVRAKEGFGFHRCVWTGSKEELLMARTRPRSCHEMNVIGREPAWACQCPI